MVAGAPAEASVAGSVTCRHSGSCKENRQKRADGLRIKSHTGKIHADMGACGPARQRSEARQSLPGRQSGPTHNSVGSFSQLGGSKSVKWGNQLGAGKHAAAQINHGRHNRQ